MNGVINGEIVRNAAIYQKAVCDVCLNCRHVRCVNVGDGCREYRDAVKAYTARNRRGERGKQRGSGTQ